MYGHYRRPASDADVTSPGGRGLDDPRAGAGSRSETARAGGSAPGQNGTKAEWALRTASPMRAVNQRNRLGSGRGGGPDDVAGVGLPGRWGALLLLRCVLIGADILRPIGRWAVSRRPDGDVSGAWIPPDSTGRRSRAGRSRADTRRTCDATPGSRCSPTQCGRRAAQLASGSADHARAGRIACPHGRPGRPTRPTRSRR